MINFEALNDAEIIKSYGAVIKELRRRKIVRSKNIVGDLGERLAIEIYRSTPGLPNLQAAPIGTQNVDALSKNGERYTIKTTTSNSTGVFYGLPPKGVEENPTQKFEYVIIVRFDEDYRIIYIAEITWQQFLKHKRWHSRMGAWNLNINKKLINESRIVYRSDSNSVGT